MESSRVLDTTMEPENPTDKCAVCIEKNGNVVGHLPKGKYRRFSKTIFFFLRADEYGSCKVRINKSQAINRGDGMGIQCIFKGKFERLTYICSYNSMNIFCYFTISHVASVRVIRRNYAHGERNKIRVKKSSS